MKFFVVLVICCGIASAYDAEGDCKAAKLEIEKVLIEPIDSDYDIRYHYERIKQQLENQQILQNSNFAVLVIRWMWRDFACKFIELFALAKNEANRSTQATDYLSAIVQKLHFRATTTFLVQNISPSNEHTLSLQIKLLNDFEVSATIFMNAVHKSMEDNTLAEQITEMDNKAKQLFFSIELVIYQLNGVHVEDFTQSLAEMTINASMAQVNKSDTHSRIRDGLKKSLESFSTFSRVFQSLSSLHETYSVNSERNLVKRGLLNFTADKLAAAFHLEAFSEFILYASELLNTLDANAAVGQIDVAAMETTIQSHVDEIESVIRLVVEICEKDASTLIEDVVNRQLNQILEFIWRLNEVRTALWTHMEQILGALPAPPVDNPLLFEAYSVFSKMLE